MALRAVPRRRDRPERTVHELTPSGLDELRNWMRLLLRHPSKESTQFEAGLSRMPVLPPQEAVSLLRDLALHLSRKLWQTEGSLPNLPSMKSAQ